MTKPKIAIIFYSTYGTNHQVAEAAAEAAKAAGAEVRLRRVAETAPKAVVEGQDAWKAQAAKTADILEISHEDMEWADGYFFSAPTRYGVVASQFSPKGVTLLERAWNLGMAKKSVLVVRAFNHTGRGAAGNMKRSIIDCHCKALSNGFRKAVSVVIHRGMSNGPMG